MSTLSWNEIRQRAIVFAHDWREAAHERAEAQTFWNEFFQIFGIKRRLVAVFEEPVKSLKNTYNRIDLFWKGRLLVEHKSASARLTKAESQAFQYIQDLAAANRHNEIPRYVILSNFKKIALFDLEPEEGEPSRLEFELLSLHFYIKRFAFFIGQKIHKIGEEDEANLKAAAIMAGLHDAVAESNYDTRAIEQLLTRILFCLFADDTGIFEPNLFELYLTNHTREDGGDLGLQLHALFETLDTPQNQRNRYLDEDLAAFPFVNGALFRDRLPTAGFTPVMRNHLMAACMFDWSRISPAIFGSLFQGIMDPKERRQIGAHYTSESNILKVIRPLFLDDLRAEFEQIRADTRAGHRRNRLMDFQHKIASLKFLDPACGCGNFLVIAYRELRRLEHEILGALSRQFSVSPAEIFNGDESAKLSQVDVDQFFGIEIGEWPARIAETALWLTDHQMNIELSQATGNLFQRIPLRAAPHILCANALQVDWNALLPASECSYVLGNPPFIGKKEQSLDQKKDHSKIWDNTKGSGILDYVTCWYVKAGYYTKGHHIRCAFVSTNSIAQGEQVSILWNRLFNEFSFKIHFAHSTFAWASEAKGAAHVHVVIIGFGPFDVENKLLYTYHILNNEPHVSVANNINPYLADAIDVLIPYRRRPVSDVPLLNYGSMMIDKDRSSGTEDGLIIDKDERDAIIRECPALEPYIRRIVGSDEFINGTERWCLWLVDAPVSVYRKCERLKSRIERIREFRLGSSREATQKLASKPYLFGEIRQPDSEYLLIPKISSEQRLYMPIGFLPSDVIASGSALILPKATLYHFGILQSSMHMAWMRQVGGRMKSDYQYSISIIYNNFVWPPAPKPAQRARVEQYAQEVLDIRQQYLDQGNTLADLYDPLTMPAALVKAHRRLDRAVERCYRSQKFEDDRDRVEHLFELYDQLTSPLAPNGPVRKKRRPRRKPPPS